MLTRRPSLRARLVLIAGLLLVVPRAGALAQERKSVAVLEFPGAPKVQAAVAQTLRKGYTLLSLVKWNATAKRLNATGRAADEIAMVATELRVDAVVTGTVKKDKGTGSWTLSVSARNGPTGKSADKLRYALKGPRVDPGTLRQLLSEIGPAVDKAVLGQPEAPAVAEAPKLDAPAAEPPGREDNPFEKLKQAEDEEKRKAAKQRPVFYPYIDLGAGFVLGGRRFSFDEEQGNSPIKCYDYDKRGIDPTDPTAMRTVFRYTNALRKCPGFAASVAGGLRLDVTAYPLAWLPISPLRGLGIGGTFDIMFWPASKVCNKNADGMCVTPGAELQTSEFRAEVGLRWNWNILSVRSRPSVMLQLQYGVHQFAIQKETKSYSVTDPMTNIVTPQEGVDDHGLPDLRYQYLDLGIGGRVPYYATDKYYLGLVLDFHYHVMLDWGDIQTRFIDFDRFYGGYGPISGGYGLRVGFMPVEFVWKGLTARLSGYYEVFAMSFDLANADKGNALQPPLIRDAENSSRHIAQGASDQYFGAVLQIGYQF